MIKTVGIVPFYSTSKDEVEVLREMLGRMARHFDKVIVIDDGSGLLRAGSLATVELVCLNENCGKATAVKAGLQHAIDLFETIEVFGQVDYDRDQTADDFPSAFAHLRGGYDLVIGDRYAPHKGVPEYRAHVLRLQEAICEVLGFPGIRDAVSGLSAYTAEFARSLISMSQSKGWGWDFEKVIIASLIGAKVSSFFLTHSRLRSAFTSREKLMEIIEDGIFPHARALRNVGKGMLTVFLEEIFSHLEKKENFEIDLNSIGGLGKARACLKQDVYTFE